MTDYKNKDLDDFDDEEQKQKKPEPQTPFVLSMNELATMAKELQEKTMAVKAAILQEYEAFEQDKINYKKEQDIMANRISQANEEIVELNVGGQFFTTFKSTLQKAKGSMLAAMFSGQFNPGVKDKTGRYFLDRPPKYFELILDSLRTGDKLYLPEDEAEFKALETEIEYFGLKKYFEKEFMKGQIIGSKILDQQMCDQLIKWITQVAGRPKKNWKICYRATQDGFSSSVFRAKASHKGPTITVIQSSNGYIFGGYTPISWNTNNVYQYDPKCFLFSLKNPANKPVMMPCTGPHVNNQHGIYQGSSYGPTFGGGHDIYICNSSNTTSSSYTNLGHSYSLPGYTYSTTQIKNFLTGSYNFTTSEIEVFYESN